MAKKRLLSIVLSLFFMFSFVTTAFAASSVSVWYSDKDYVSYSSTYIINVISIVKGSAASVPSSMNLPPDLDQNMTYYIMLKESPYEDGTYSLFSRSFSVIPSTSNIAENLLSTQ